MKPQHTVHAITPFNNACRCSKPKLYARGITHQIIVQCNGVTRTQICHVACLQFRNCIQCIALSQREAIFINGTEGSRQEVFWRGDSMRKLKWNCSMKQVLLSSIKTIACLKIPPSPFYIPQWERLHSTRWKNREEKTKEMHPKKGAGFPGTNPAQNTKVGRIGRLRSEI